MNDVFSFDESKDINNNALSNDTDLLIKSVRNIQSLPINDDEKNKMIEQEIVIFNLLRSNIVNNLNNFKKLDYIKTNLFNSINYISSVSYENIRYNNAVKIYSELLLLIKFLKYKTNSLKNNEFRINYKGKVYTKLISRFIDYDKCETILKENALNEIVDIDSEKRNSITYSTINNIHRILVAIKGVLSEIYSSEILTYEFFGYIPKSDIEKLTNEINNVDAEINIDDLKNTNN